MVTEAAFHIIAASQYRNIVSEPTSKAGGIAAYSRPSPRCPAERAVHVARKSPASFTILSEMDRYEYEPTCLVMMTHAVVVNRRSDRIKRRTQGIGPSRSDVPCSKERQVLNASEALDQLLDEHFAMSFGRNSGQRMTGPEFC
jgi:hypothetical protein